MHAEHADGLGVVQRPRATRLISAIACRNSAIGELPPGRSEIVGASHPTVGSSTPKDLFFLRVLRESAFHLRKNLPSRYCRQPVMDMLTTAGRPDAQTWRIMPEPNDHNLRAAVLAAYACSARSSPNI